MYTYEEALEASTRYFCGDEMAAQVWLSKYALTDADGTYLEATPEHMHRRLAKEFARIEAGYPNPLTEDEIFGLLGNFLYLVPQGSPMSGIGNDSRLQSLSNCFVIPGPVDSYGGIMLTDQEQVQLMKRRGGVGFDISAIRPKGQPTSNAAVTTDGIGVFMERYSNTCREVAQGGRRGALMLTCSVHHPEVLTFITIKNQLDDRGKRTKVTGANVSVRVSDEFMRSVSEDTEYEQRWPVDADKPVISRWVRARVVWDAIVNNAHASAEPGVLFWDTATEESPADAYSSVGFGSTSTNPCVTGETLIATADGRGAVPIHELASDGADVPVYCCDRGGRVAVRMMRRPRLTKKNAPVVKVTLDDGTSLRVTKDHKFLTARGEYVEAGLLCSGDALHVAWRQQQPIKPKGKNYWWVRSWNKARRGKSEHRMVYEFLHGEIPEGHVIHHVDYDSLNNSPENLRCMSADEHDDLHRADKLGAQNPIHRVLADPTKSNQYRTALSRACSGTLNGNSCGLSNQDLLDEVSGWIASLGYVPTVAEYTARATDVGWPRVLVGFRKEAFDSLGGLVLSASKKVGVVLRRQPSTSADPAARLQFWRTQTNLDLAIHGGEVHVSKTCEECGSQFHVNVKRRETAYCSYACSAAATSKNPEFRRRQIEGIRKAWAAKDSGSRLAKLEVYTELREELNREPTHKEWEARCAKKGVSRRIGKVLKGGFKTWSELREAARTHNHRVVSVTADGVADVYNGTVDEFHNYYVVGKSVSENGKTNLPLLNTLNCGEIILSNYDSCRLMALNLTAFVRYSFLDTSRFDYEAFFLVVCKAQRLMDDLVDLEHEKIDQILAKLQNDPEPPQTKRVEIELWEKVRLAAVNGRRTGLGITGLGDTLAMLGIRYGSEEAIRETAAIYQILAIASYSSSILMAKERGPFPRFSLELERDHPFIRRMVDACHHPDAYYEYGRRNIANLTTAPTGSVSIMTQTTSGIEPVYALSYVRRRKMSQADIAAGKTPDFIDALGDQWVHYRVLHHGFKQWCIVNGLDVNDTEACLAEAHRSPYAGSTADEIDWEARVEMQAAAQRWVCHAISSTINLPASTPKEVVSTLYLKAWKLGCKGVTIYRDGCRDGVLVKDEKDSFEPRTAPARPERLECRVHQTKVKQGDDYLEWVFLVGLLDGKPYEVFGGFSDTIELSKRVTEGWIEKRKLKSGTRYDLAYGDEDAPTRVRDIVKVFDNPEQGVFTRLVSTSLRHGTPVQFIVEQLQRDRASDMHTFAKGLSRILKEYIQDGTKVAGRACDSCGATGSLIYQEGCMTCTACGYSKCG